MTKYIHLAVNEETYQRFQEAKKEYCDLYPEVAVLKPSNNHILRHIIEAWLNA